LIDGVVKGGMGLLADWTLAADRAIVF